MRLQQPLARGALQDNRARFSFLLLGHVMEWLHKSVGGTLNEPSLADRAQSFRTLVELHDGGNSETRKRLRPLLLEKTEELAAALLAAGRAEPLLKAEILAWVIKFRKERHPQRAVGPITHVFDYDTTDPRTKNNSRQGKKNRFLRSNFGSSPRAIAFAHKLLELRQDVAEALTDPGVDRASLLDRIVKLYQSRNSELKSNFNHEVGDELDGMAIRVGGITAREAAAATRSMTIFHKPVPDEVAPIFTKGVLSGGLPTLGRGRR